MSPETLLRVVREAYVQGELTVEQLEANVGAALRGEVLPRASFALLARISMLLHAQVRCVTSETISGVALLDESEAARERPDCANGGTTCKDCPGCSNDALGCSC